MTARNADPATMHLEARARTQRCQAQRHDRLWVGALAAGFAILLGLPTSALCASSLTLNPPGGSDSARRTLLDFGPVPGGQTASRCIIVTNHASSAGRVLVVWDTGVEWCIPELVEVPGSGSANVCITFAPRRAQQYSTAILVEDDVTHDQLGWYGLAGLGTGCDQVAPTPHPITDLGKLLGRIRKIKQEFGRISPLWHVET